jgi:hypothetical protein
LGETYVLRNLKVSVKRIQAILIAGLLLLILILPQVALAAGPEISDVVVQDITATTATIYWTTNTSSDSQVNYGTNRPKDGTWTSEDDLTDVTHHAILLEGLTANDTYYFEVESEDAGGTTIDNNGGEYYSFKTLAWYSITLDPACGVCGDLWEAKVCDELIGVTAVVAAEGDYRICWDSRSSNNVVYGGTFKAVGAGTYTLTFRMPEAKRGIHKVYLTNSFYDDLGSSTVAEFVVNPSVKIDPEEGPVGTEVTLNGYGFDASQAIGVTLVQGDVEKGEEKTATANTVGSWELSYTIPEIPAGGYTFEVGRPNSDEVWVIKHFEVTPKITAPSSGTVGQTIKVEGTGFASEEEDIEVTFDGEVRKENISANKDGSWTANIIVPIRTCDRYDIGASGQTTRARDVDPVEFTVVAGISVTPALAYVGDEITVTGGGFAPGEDSVRVTFDGTVVATNIPVNIYGCWESSFNLPGSAYGSHTVSASGETTAAVTTTLDTQAQMTELSPAQGAPGDSISLTGNGFHGNQDLTVTIGGVAASGDIRTQSNGNVNISFRVSKGSPEGKQTLVVTDEGGATDSTDFTVEKKTLSTTPLPISPKDNTLRSGEVNFNWQGSTGSTSYTYTLEINTSASSGKIWDKSGITESSYTLAEEEALPKGTYYWRVKVVDDYGNEGAWSDSIEFTVSPIPTWVWVVVGLVVLVVLMVVAYRETKFKVTE